MTGLPEQNGDDNPTSRIVFTRHAHSLTRIKTLAMRLNKALGYRLLTIAIAAYAGILILLVVRAADRNATAITTHQNIWSQRKPPHYRYTLEFGAASVLSFAGPVQIEVKHGNPVSIRQKEQRSTFDPASFSEVSTIEKLFAFIRRTITERHDRVELEFDPIWGYPTRALMAQNAVDADTEVRVTAFAPLH